VPEQITPQLFTEPAESELYARLTALLTDVTPLLDAGNYSSALERLAGLRQPVDQFL